MNSPCVNCGADAKVCKDCDWYNGIWMPKDQYNARLKADLVAILTDIQLEIKELDGRCGYAGYGRPTFAGDYVRKETLDKIIQQKISSLKESKDGSN